MGQEDLIRTAVQPVNDYLGAFLVNHHLSGAVVGAFLGLLQVGELAVMMVALAVVCARPPTWDARAAGAPGPGGSGAAARALAAAGAALLLLWWSLRFPSRDILTFFGRWDHLAFCAFAGYALSYVRPSTRRWMLSALSAYFMEHYIGRAPFMVVMSGALIAYMATRARLAARPWATVLLQGVILAGTSAMCWHLRSTNLYEALRAQGAFGFVLLRHVSFVVDTRQRALSASLRDYLSYMLFYPSFIGASEVYHEFAEHNFSPDARCDHSTAALKAIAGQLQVWASMQIDTSFDHVLQVQSTPLLWGNVLVLFVRSALFVMGLWATIEAAAMLYGFRLRPNFFGLLQCENPAQFWRSWRATMTNWLIQYIYIPLGGNRRWQTRNIFAAFAVSTAWHCMGMPFFAPKPQLWHLVPIVAWGALNAAAVAGYAWQRRLGVHILPAQTPNAVRRAAKILLTLCIATFTVTLLDFRPGTMDQFQGFVRRILGLH
jgi:D-alanyl-lipoteichoic acid acyltransferase DltB (MBOAT superfamily)